MTEKRKFNFVVAKVDDEEKILNAIPKNGILFNGDLNEARAERDFVRNLLRDDSYNIYGLVKIDI